MKKTEWKFVTLSTALPGDSNSQPKGVWGKYTDHLTSAIIEIVALDDTPFEENLLDFLYWRSIHITAFDVCVYSRWLHFCREIENFLSQHWCSPLWKMQTATFSVNYCVIVLIQLLLRLIEFCFKPNFSSKNHDGQCLSNFWGNWASFYHIIWSHCPHPTIRQWHNRRGTDVINKFREKRM